MNYSAVSTIWVLFGTSLIFFMQAGFAMLEAGFTRKKNSGNIIMKNIMDFCIGAIAYWVVGFGLMYGGNGVLFGSIRGFAAGSIYGTSMLPDGVPFFAFAAFQMVFAVTAATIASGSMAGRMKFSAYCLSSLFITMIIYPISGHWIWGNGWLQKLGFHDFAGSAAVHIVGGITALIGAAFVGPRIGKYSRSGKSRPIPGHSIPMAALGVFILWFCWFGFNGCSTMSMEADAIEKAGKIFFNTIISASAAGCSAMIFTWIRYKKPDISMTLNGVLGGLVVITAGCDTISAPSAALAGILAGILVDVFIELLENKAKIDDPVGASAVHGGCGILGTLWVGLFSDGTDTAKGLFMGGGAGQLGVQCLGIVAVGLYVACMSAILFAVVKRAVGLRVSPEAETDGLDISEHNLTSGYSEYLSLGGVSAPMMNVPKISEENLDVQKQDAVKEISVITKIVIIAKQSKLEALLHAMNEIGVTGVTITNVTGYGIQRGNQKYYRSSEMDINLLPKVKIEIVVSTVPVSKVISAAEKILYTGKFGDGKIFISDIRNVIKVRTGEEGLNALVDRGEE